MRLRVAILIVLGSTESMFDFIFFLDGKEIVQAEANVGPALGLAAAGVDGVQERRAPGPADARRVAPAPPLAHPHGRLPARHVDLILYHTLCINQNIRILNFHLKDVTPITQFKPI